MDISKERRRALEGTSLMYFRVNHTGNGKVI